MAVSEASRLNGKLKILTFGAGAIGTYIGGSLALAGHPVVFVERHKAVEELREKGLRLDLTADSRRQTKDATVVEPRSFVVVSTLEEALRSYTYENAYGVFAEEHRGMLKPGYLADLVLLDQDLGSIPAVQIEGARVKATIVGGKVVYQATE